MLILGFLDYLELGFLLYTSSFGNIIILVID